MGSVGGRQPVITIDGPAGAGKSTAARRLARRLGFLYVDSGALYRALTYLLRQHGVSQEAELESSKKAVALRIILDSSRFSVRADAEGATRLYLDDRDITSAVRSREVEQLVPFVAKHQEVRDGITTLQRRLAARGRVVLEGRDAGTVVVPDAEVKFFLTADIVSRAERRFLELRGSNAALPLDEVKREIAARDRLDQNRAISPLRAAADAIEIDTSRFGSNETVEMMLGIVRDRLGAGADSQVEPRPQTIGLIAVTGLIGVGKSTFCEWLGAQLQLPVYREDPDSNPYITAYYKDSARWALHSQLWFLYRKHELLTALADQHSSGVIDRSLHEDYMFARILLTGSDLEIYEHLYLLVFSLAPPPALIISLEASVQELMRRIRARGRNYEMEISERLLVGLTAEYESWITEYADCPVIRVNTESFDLREESARRTLLGRVHRALVPVGG